MALLDRRSDVDRDARVREREAARHNRDRRDYDEFRESVATPVPNRSYRSSVDMVDDRTSVAEQVVRIVAVALGALLGIRFIINLFSYPRTSGFATFIYATTGWAVQPFQYLFGQPPATTGGYFDWPALAAIVAVGIVASILIALLRPRA